MRTEICGLVCVQRKCLRGAMTLMSSSSQTAAWRSNQYKANSQCYLRWRKTENEVSRPVFVEVRGQRLMMTQTKYKHQEMYYLK